MDAKKVKEFCEIKEGQVPLTRFIDAHEAIDAEFINGPDPSTFEEVFKRFATLSWFEDYKEKLDTESMTQITHDFVKGNILAQGLECGRFTFVFKGLSLHNSHAIVRTRIGASYLQQSQAVSDFRHSDILVPPALMKDMKLLERYKQNAIDGKMLYGDMLDSGFIAIDDARMCLSKAIPVWIGCSFTLASLMGIYSKRTDTQEEAYVFNLLFEKVRNLVVEKYPYLDKCFVYDDPKRCIHTRPGYKSNAIYKRNLEHQILGYEDTWTLHDKTKHQLVVMDEPFLTEYYLGKMPTTEAIYNTLKPKTNY